MQRWLVVARLLGEGLHPDARDVWGKSALYYAAKHGATDAILLLHRAGATVDLPTAQGSTALMVAAAGDRRTTVQLLLELNADPSLTNCDGRSAADFAVEASMRTLLRERMAPRRPAKATAHCAHVVDTADRDATANASATAALDPATACALRLMTFNVRYGDRRDTSITGWAGRRRRVLDLVHLARPDVIAFQVVVHRARRRCLPAPQRPDREDVHAPGGAAACARRQEVLDDQMTDLQHGLPEYAASGVGRDDGKRRGEFAPLFVRRCVASRQRRRPRAVTRGPTLAHRQPKPKRPRRM